MMIRAGRIRRVHGNFRIWTALIMTVVVMMHGGMMLRTYRS